MSDMTFITMEPLPPGLASHEIMQEDAFHMMTTLGTNVAVLHASHPSEVMGYLILLHIPTGKRLKIQFPEQDPRGISTEVMGEIMRPVVDINREWRSLNEALGLLGMGDLGISDEEKS